jgi:protein SCO1/2
VRSRLVAVLLALLGTTLAACGGAGADGGADGQDAFRGAVLDEPYDVPDLALTDTEGEPYSLAADTDRPLTLVFFGYTHCPDICQVVMASLASALTRLDDADREQVDVVFVTTDPARDDTVALREYLDRFDPSFIGLTGELDRIIELGKPIAVFVEEGEKLPTGGYEVAHSTQVTAIDEGDQVPVVWTQGTSASEFADDIHALLAED